MNNLVFEIKSLPPLIKEEVLGVTLDSIKNDIKKEISQSSVEIIEELTKSLILSEQKSEYWNPLPRMDIDIILYKNYIDIALNFVKNHYIGIDNRSANFDLITDLMSDYSSDEYQ
jgi:hypothetical protein